MQTFKYICVFVVLLSFRFIMCVRARKFYVIAILQTVNDLKLGRGGNKIGSTYVLAFNTIMWIILLTISKILNDTTSNLRRRILYFDSI